MASPIRTAIYQRLAGDSTLTGMLATPTSIFHQVAPQDSAYPVVVFNKQGGTPDWQFGGAYVQADLWQVKAISMGGSAASAEDIAARIDTVLNDAQLAITAGALLAIYRYSDVDYLETDGADQWHHCGALYRVVTEPTG